LAAARFFVARFATSSPLTAVGRSDGRRPSHMQEV
jgi:hypothetical protein